MRFAGRSVRQFLTNIHEEEMIMLGVCLLFVGIVLINNGMCTLYKVDGKSAAVMNILTGGLSVFINAVNLVQGNYYAAGTGLLFGFTYLFVAFVKLKG